MAQSDFLDLDCLAYATRRTGRAVTNIFNARLTDLDLNVSQFGLLAAVAKRPGASLASIGKAMLLDDSTLTRNFTVMERRKLIAAEGGRGRGGKSLSLTRAGEKLYAEALGIWRTTNRQLAAQMGADETAAGRVFLRALGEAAEHLKQMERPEVAATPKGASRRIRVKA